MQHSHFQFGRVFLIFIICSIIFSSFSGEVIAASNPKTEQNEVLGLPNINHESADDPILNWNTFLGANDYDIADGVTVDKYGNVYITGNSAVPWESPIRDFTNGDYLQDAFVAKLDSSGILQWNTFLGGGNFDSGRGIVVDNDGNIYVIGHSQATWGAPIRTYSDRSDAFVAKLSNSGELLWNTFLGGNGSDVGEAIFLDINGNIYATGRTIHSYGSWGSPIRAYQNADAFVVKISSSGNLLWNTFLGGGEDDWGYDLSLDSQNNIYVAGASWDSWGDPVKAYTSHDAFVAKLNNNGSLLWNTFLGGNSTDNGNSLTTDQNGFVYVAGDSSSSWSSPLRSYTDSPEGFIAKLGSDGELLWNTFLGGTNGDPIYGIILNTNGELVVVGASWDNWGTPLQSHGAGSDMDVFIAGLDTDGSLKWNSFLGGNEQDYARDIAIDPGGNLYLSGWSHDSWGNPIRPYMSSSGGLANQHMDAFVAKLGNATLPSTGKTPIVFVHGWRGFPPQLTRCTGEKYNPITLDEAEAYFQGVGDKLKTDGGYSKNEIFYAQLVSNRCYTPSFDDNVPNLMAAIDQAKAATGKSKVVLIAHSMGGLVSRAYIEGSNYRGDVESLFTFGSPHLGTPPAATAVLLNLVSLGEFCEDFQPAVCNFSELGMLIFNLSHHQNRDVTYHLISGDAPFWPRGPRGKVMDVLIHGPDDGIVPTNSGTDLAVNLDHWTTDELHGPGSDGFGSHTYFVSDGQANNSYDDCIKKVLVYGASNCGSVNTLAAMQKDTLTTLAQHTAFEYGIMLSGQSITRNIPAEGGAALFASQWQDGVLAFTLVDPNGQAIDPTYATANPSVVTYSEDANAATYYFSNATVGTWQMVLQPVDLPDEGATFTTFAAFDSAVTMTANTDKQWYMPDETATITAMLDGSPSSATVSAKVVRTDGIVDALTFSSIGNGQYQGSYHVPNAPGYVEVRLIASGTTAGSLSFERGASLVFQISPDTFSLNNSYVDTPVLYPGLSTYQFLNIMVGINATMDGKVGLSADLVDRNGNVVAHARTLQDVTLATSNLTLQFSGADIFASQLNGPYSLTNVLLTDENGTTLVAQEAQLVYTTSSSYLYTEFDTVKPGVTSATRVSLDPTSAASVDFTVTFSEPVIDVDSGDFTLDTTGTLTGATIDTVAGSNSTWTVTVNTGSGNGTLRLDVPVTATIKDMAGNLLGNLPFMDGEFYTIEKTPTVPVAATLVSPTNSIGTKNPTYTWNEVPNATWYYLWVDGPSGYHFEKWYTAAQVNCDGSTCSIGNVTPNLAAGTYTWWVQTWNNAGDGPWSLGTTFTPMPPGKGTLTSPTGDAGTSRPTYSWNAVSDATWYYLWVDGPSGYHFEKWYTAAQANCNSSTCSITPAGVKLSSGAYTWWVQTWNEVGFGAWSDGKPFSVPLPPLPGAATLSSPTGSIGTNNPTYTWNESSDATWYLLSVDGTSGNVLQKWYTAAQANCNGSTCSVSNASPGLVATAHTWRVQTWNERGYGPWSNTMTFTPTPPGKAILASPTGNAGTNNPTYSWNAVSGATWYYLWVDGPSGSVIQKWYTSAQANCNGTTCSLSNVTPGLVAGTYTWWVQTWNEAGAGPWSDAMTFNPLPGKVTLASPSGTATNNPIYTWNAVPGATWYYLWVDGPSGNVHQRWYTAAQANCNATTCSVVGATPNLSTGAYICWIQTWNDVGYGPWSNAMTFLIP